MSHYQIFETERLLLKPTSEEDAAFILELLNTPKWITYIGDRNIKTIAEARAYIVSKMLPQLQRLGYSNYTVIRKSDNSKIGSCGLYDRVGVTGIDIGFAFLPQHEKRGYAFEATNKLKNVAFEVFGLNEINAITLKENSASRKLLNKLGLKFIKVVKLPDDKEELLLYNLKALVS